ncbi:MAG TPA: hypothetical protein VGO00_05995 [Kofleriaceae bacterium]|jgi:hypothetical protein|nr:hypothetical protein [Kofleriaceae bacterium]
MRAAWLVLLVAACDLQPPPKQAPAPPLAPAAVPVDADDTAACATTAGHIADVLIGAADQTSRVALEHDRPLLVQRTADGCNRDHWTDEVRGCYGAANDAASLDRCGKLVAKRN